MKEVTETYYDKYGNKICPEVNQQRCERCGGIPHEICPSNEPQDWGTVNGVPYTSKTLCGICGDVGIYDRGFCSCPKGIGFQKAIEACGWRRG